MRPILRLDKLAQVSLGLLILWQLVFVASATSLRALGMLRDVAQFNQTTVPEEPQTDPFRLAGHLGTAVETWSQLIGQHQAWGFFGPLVAKDYGFLEVQLRWDNKDWRAPAVEAREPEFLLSDAEPKNPEQFFHLGSFRLRNYEALLVRGISVPSGVTPEKVNANWRKQVVRFVRRDGDRLLSYLRYKLRDFLRSQPETPRPHQVIALIRLYQPPTPGEEPWRLQGPYEFPLVLWEPGGHVAPGYYLFEIYDPDLDRFEAFRFDGSPANP